MFSKNIKNLEKVNKALASKLQSVDLDETSKHIEAAKTPEGEYVLLRDGNFVEDLPSPIASAKEVFSQNIKQATTRHDFILIFGLGIGNLLDYVHSKTITKLVLYEPDLNILRFTFENVDLSKYFADGRLYITNNLPDISEYLREKYLLDDRVEFVYLKNYLLQHQSEFKMLTDVVFDSCQSKIIDMNTTKKMSKVWLNNIFTTIKSNKKSFPITILKDKFKDKTALILGAGPSLKDNIEELKTNRNKYVIFAVHRTLPTLKAEGITPDFCVINDAKWVQASIINDDEFLKNINLICDIKADGYINMLPAKNHFKYYSQNCSFNEKLRTKLSGELELCESGGTSAICAYNCAKILGFKNLIFAGIDLAFKDGTVYCDGKTADKNNDHSVKIQNVVRETTTIKSITGKYVQTRRDYAIFVKQFEILFAKDKTSKLYNLTDFGAYINWMNYIDAKSIFEKLPANDFDIDSILKTEIEKNQSYSEKISTQSLSLMKEDKEKTSRIVEKIDEWFEMYSEHPKFFDYAAKIVTSITSTMLLMDFIQIELIKFAKLVTSNNDKEKKDYLVELFKQIRVYFKTLDNLI